MERKVYHGAMAFKDDGQPGEFSAVFSTFDVIDHDRDVTLPGAFEENAPVRIAAWGHGWDQLPVGRGEIHAVETEAKVDGRFFLDTAAGKEHYLTVRALGDLQEWSFSYDILEHEYGKRDGQDVRFLKRLKVHEVSPVMLGAGIDTRTLDIKGLEQDVSLAELMRLLKVYLGEIEGEVGNGKPREKPGESTIVRIAVDIIDYGLQAPKEGA